MAISTACTPPIGYTAPIVISVVAWNNCGNSDTGSVLVNVGATPSDLNTDDPDTLACSLTEDTVSWDPVAGADEYKLFEMVDD